MRGRRIGRGTGVHLLKKDETLFTESGLSRCRRLNERWEWGRWSRPRCRDVDSRHRLTCRWTGSDGRCVGSEVVGVGVTVSDGCSSGDPEGSDPDTP